MRTIIACGLVLLVVLGCDRKQSLVPSGTQSSTSASNGTRSTTSNESINSLDAEGHTPLMRAVAAGDVLEIRRLLSLGADVDFAGDGGQTPLMLAWRSPGLGATEALLLGKPMLDLVDQRGFTALMASLSSGRPDVGLSLIDAGAGLSIQDSKGRTALSLAAELCADPSVMRRMITKGANPNVRIGREDLTPLMLAASSGNAQVLQALLDGGAELEAKDYRGWTAVSYAIALNKTTTLKSLMKAGAMIGDAAYLAMTPDRKDCMAVLREAGISIPEPDPSVRSR